MKAALLPGLLLFWCALLLGARTAPGAVVISAIGDQTISEDTSTAAIAFSITGFQSRSPAVSAQSDNANLVRSAGLVIAGTGGARTITVTPEPNAFGSATITVTATDIAGTDTETFLLTVRAVNDAPTITAIANQAISEDRVAGPLSFTINDVDTPVTRLTVTTSSSNTQLVPLTGISVGGTSNDRTLTITPAANQSGSAVIGVVVSDGVLSDTIRFTLTVTAVNDPPTVSRIADQSVNEDNAAGPISFTVGDLETSASLLVVTATSSNQGLVPNANLGLGVGATSPTLRTLTATPLPDQFGVTTISVNVSDGTVTTSTSFVLTVVGVNDTPTISKLGSMATDEDVTLGPIPFTVDDPETAPDQLVVTATSTDQKVIADSGIQLGGSGASRTLTLVPVPNASGSTLVTLRVSDGQATGGMEFVVRVNPINDTPTLTGVPDQQIPEDGSTGDLPFTVADVETAASDLVVNASASDTTLFPRGSLVLAGTGSARTIRATPGKGLSGKALITLTASDGVATGSREFTIVVVAANRPPTISRIADQSINEDTSTAALAFTVADTETSAANLVVTGSSGNTSLVPANGIVLGGSGGSRTVTVTPAANQSGSAVISLTVSDGAASATTSFTVTVAAVNDPPTITKIADVSINEDASTAALAFTVADVETAAANLVVTGASGNTSLVPANGIVLGGSGGSRTVTVTPAANQSGSAVISLTVSDGAASATTAFSVTVIAVNDPPTITRIADVAINEDDSTAALAFTVADLETAAANLVVTGASANTALVPANGIVLGGSGGSRTVTITPAANQSGSSVISLTVSDGAASATTAFTVTVVALNDPPTITRIADVSINEDDSTAALAFTVADVETAAANLVVTGASANTSLVPANGIVLGGSGGSRTVTVTPAANQSGSAAITLTVSDGAASTTTSFTVTVNPLNDVPTISKLADQTLNEDTSSAALAFTVGDVETAAANLVVTAVSSDTTLIPSTGLALGGSGANRTITVSPASNRSGSAVVTLTVSDGSATASTAFNVDVLPVNDLPTISRLADQSINEDTNTGLLGFTVGDAETSPGSLTVSATSSNTGLVPTGNVVLGGSGAERTVIVTPAANQSGSVVITLTVNDGTATASTAFTVNVAPVNDPPTISSVASQSIPESGATAALAFTVGDLETAAASLTVTASSSNPTVVPAAGLSLGGSGANRTITVTAAVGQSGSAVITLTVSDGSASSSTSFTVLVNEVNDPPTITRLADQSINEDSSTAVLAFTVGDPETAPGSLVVTAASSNTALVPSSGLSLGGTGANRTIRVTPAANQSGAAVITLTVSDGAASVSTSFTVNVSPVNDPPTITSVGDQAINEDSSTGALSFSVGDPETAAGNLTVTAVSADTSLVPAAGLTLGGSGAARTLTVTPAGNRSGSTVITLTVSDGAASTSTSFTLVVREVNDPPTISRIPDQSINEDSSTPAIAFTVADGETAAANLVVTATSSDATIIPVRNVLIGGTGGNRTVTVTPAANQSGLVIITLSVSDGSAAASASFTVSVAAINDPPTISDIPDQGVQGGSNSGPIAFTVGDPDTALTALVVSATSSNPSLVPSSGIVFGGSAGNRTVTVTPSGTAGGTSVITVTVSDGALSARDAFTVTVTSTVEPPKISAAPVPQTVNEGDTALLSVSVTGTAPFTFQWFLNGKEIAGATSSTLTLRSVLAAQAGEYTVRIGNAAGSVTSPPAVLTVRRLDFGDAPDGTSFPAYPTLLARDGARHVISAGFFLGKLVDAEPDAHVSPDATGDDSAGADGDDEDGVEFITNPWVAGQTVQVRVTLTSSGEVGGRLDAFADLNQDGVWSVPSERIFSSQALVPGVNNLSFAMPAEVKPGTTLVRFRLSRQGALGPTGLAPDGEVEDYLVRLQGPSSDRFDFGDAPESSLAVLYRTKSALGGPRHRIAEGFFLGKSVDAEPDGQPSADALGDDSVPAGAPDDEDGVQFVSPLIPGQSASLVVTASTKGVLDAWIDFNRAQGFDPADRVLTRFQLNPGENSITIAVPPGAVAGTTYARFRLSREGVDSPNDAGSTAPVPEGEVEDYQVTVTVPEVQLDFGDAPEIPAGLSGAAGYPTTLARNGARHVISKEWFLGKLVDAEKDGQPDANALGDDQNPKEPDDEDGVVFSGKAVAGQTLNLVVTASQTGRLDAWIDFNRNASWADQGEQVFVSKVLAGGPNALTVQIPPGARPGVTFARFRFSRDGKLGFTGQAPTGEVEDHRLVIESSGPCDADSQGTDFWVTFPGNYPASPLAPLRLTVCINGPAGTTGNVAAPGLRFSKDFVIPASQVFEVVLPDAASLGDVIDVVQTKGVHITSSQPVAVYGLNRIPYSSDGFVGLPVGSIGTEYLILAYPNVFSEVSALNGTQFALVATEDQTTVTIIPSRSVLGHPAGVPYEVVLNAGQTYQLRHPEDATADLSGTEIHSDLPVAVFSGHQCANINSPGKFFCDHLVEQLPPVNAWGKVFLTVPLATRSNGDVFRLIASADNTQVFVNGANNGTLNRGKVKTLQLTGPSRITTDKPVYLAQFATSSDFDGVEKADPFMAGVTPVRFYAADQRICTGPAALSSHYISVVAPASVVGSLTLDGAVVPAASFAPLGATGFSFARLSVAAGTHRLLANLGFATMAYGYGPLEAYGWPGGIHFGDITPPEIVCPPDLVTNVGGFVAGTISGVPTVRCTLPVPDFRPQAQVTDNCQIPTQRGVIQIPAPGTQVGPGEHTITLIAEDLAGNQASCSFTMRVLDTGVPSLQCPKDFAVRCNKGLGATVAFQVIARTPCGTLLPVESTPASGSLFPPGITVVTSKVPGHPDITCTFRVNVICQDTEELWLKARRSPTLSWSGPAMLETATSPEGPWTPVPMAVSPFTPAAYGEQQFFRLQSVSTGPGLAAPSQPSVPVLRVE